MQSISSSLNKTTIGTVAQKVLGKYKNTKQMWKESYMYMDIAVKTWFHKSSCELHAYAVLSHVPFWTIFSSQNSYAHRSPKTCSYKMFWSSFSKVNRPYSFHQTKLNWNLQRINGIWDKRRVSLKSSCTWRFLHDKL